MTLLVDIPQSLFTPESFGTLFGATGAVYLVCNTAQRIWNFNPKWLALAVSILISFIAAAISKNTIPGVGQIPVPENLWLKYFIAFLNGLLIYATATGSNTITSGEDNMPPGPGIQSLSLSRKFFTRWKGK